MIIDAVALRWPNDSTLTVGFVNEGLDQPQIEDEAFRARIEICVAVWESFANIKFRFVNDQEAPDADIRIAFVNLPRTSFSSVGQDSLDLKPGPSMWLQRLLGGAENSVVLHEFGHVLGARHEHQRNDTNITWDIDLVRAEYTDRGRGTANIENDVIAVQPELLLLADRTPYDPLSIMHYPIPLVYNAGVVIPRNLFLSQLDKSFIARYYPHPQRNIGTVTFTGDNTPKDRDITPVGQGSTLTYGLVSLDVTHNQAFRVHNTIAEGESLTSARLGFLETALDDRTFQVGHNIFTPNQPAHANGVLNTFNHILPITFPHSFWESNPVVVVWLSSINTNETNGARIEAHAANITELGFNLHIESPGACGISSVGVSWVAFPNGTPGIQAGNVEPLGNGTQIQFTDDIFTEEATVLIAVNRINFALNELIQFSMTPVTITAQGITLNMPPNVSANYLAMARMVVPNPPN